MAFAKENRTGGSQKLQDSSWSARLDSLRVLWYRRIVNFDSRQQVQMIEQVKTFTTDSGSALKLRLEAFGKSLKEWLARPWDAGRIVRSLGWGAGAAGLGWLLWRLAGRGWQRWQFWRRPAEYDPVRRTAGQWLGRLRQPAEDQPAPRLRLAGREQEIDVVVGDLQRLRYGRRETWPEPRAVFKRAKQARRVARR